MLATSARNAVKIGLRSFSTIPVGQVATHFRFNVKDEATAIKADEFVKNTVLPVASATSGFVKGNRTVCKTEWAYELFFIWDNAANYGAWKESKQREELMTKLPPFLNENGISMTDGFYSGVRVYDEMK
jgi:antibiotic biosynthesis monooxygenase (ABM) superfamily enzyme